MSSLWIVRGDFNAILPSGDTLCGNLVTVSEVMDIHDYITDCKVEQMPNDGGKYSWKDRKKERIFSKLDWVLVNGVCPSNMPDMKSFIMPEGVSYHCTLVVQMIQTNKKKSKVFNYCNIWSTHSLFIHSSKDIGEATGGV